MFPSIRVIAFAVSAVAALHVCQGQTLPPDIFRNVVWSVHGSDSNQAYGAMAISVLGHTGLVRRRGVAISEHCLPGRECSGRIISPSITDARVGDTTRGFEFPGSWVTPMNANGDAYPDFLCKGYDCTVQLLLGTAVPDSFVTALTFNEGGGAFQGANPLFVADCDSDGFDDFLVAAGNNNSIKLFRGGPVMDTVSGPSQIQRDQPYMGEWLAMGNVHGGGQQYIVSAPLNGDILALYKVGPGFTLSPAETISCTLQGNFETASAILDADGDGIDDILLATSAGVEIFKGGDSISRSPTYILHRPLTYFGSGYTSFLMDAGDVTGHGYHTLILGDGGANGNTGEVFLFNLGPALTDSCVAYGIGPTKDSWLGWSSAAPGDLTGDGRDDILLGCGTMTTGAVYMIAGDPAWGPVISSVAEHPSSSALQMGAWYPNPIRGIARAEVSVSGTLASEAATVIVVDVMGRTVRRVFAGRGRDLPHTVHFAADGLSAGVYEAVLACGAQRECQTVRVVR